MVTIMGLHDSLNDFLQTNIASKFKLKTTDRSGAESFKEPQVIKSGWILPKSIDDETYSDTEEFPYILTRVGKIENGKGTRDSIVTMGIFLGIYDPGVYDEDGRLVDDGSGYRDFWNLVEETRLELFQQQVIDNKYRIISEFFEAEMLGGQEYPYWEGFCLTKWHVVYPQIKLEPEEFFHTKQTVGRSM